MQEIKAREDVEAEKTRIEQREEERTTAKNVTEEKAQSEQMARKDMEEEYKINADCTTIEALFKEISTRKELELKLQKVSKVPKGKTDTPCL